MRVFLQWKELRLPIPVSVYTLTLSMLILKKNLIRYIQWKVSNFALIFYVLFLLHKKSKQSLRPSTGHIGWDFQLWNSLVHTCHAQTSDCQGHLCSKPWLLWTTLWDGVYIVISFLWNTFIHWFEKNYEYGMVSMWHDNCIF